MVKTVGKKNTTRFFSSLLRFVVFTFIHSDAVVAAGAEEVSWLATCGIAMRREREERVVCLGFIERV